MHQNLDPAFIFAGIILLMILIVFLTMIIAAIVSLIREDRAPGKQTKENNFSFRAKKDAKSDKTIMSRRS